MPVSAAEQIRCAGCVERASVVCARSRLGEGRESENKPAGKPFQQLEERVGSRHGVSHASWSRWGLGRIHCSASYPRFLRYPPPSSAINALRFAIEARGLTEPSSFAQAWCTACATDSCIARIDSLCGFARSAIRKNSSLRVSMGTTRTRISTRCSSSDASNVAQASRSESRARSGWPDDVSIVMS